MGRGSSLLHLLVLFSAVGTVGCVAPSIEGVGDAEDTAIWLRGEGATPEGGRLVAHALVLSTLPDYCERFEERWAATAAAVPRRSESLDALPDGPSEARCEAELIHWKENAEIEENLYFQNARHSVLFQDLFEPEDWSTWPEEVGRLEAGEVQMGVGSFGLHAVRAGPTPCEVRSGLGDCGDLASQELADGGLSYLGPPRETWAVMEGSAEVTSVTETRIGVTLADVELQFSREVSYESNVNDSVTIDEEPRDPVRLSFSRTFERCDVPLEVNIWPWLYLWAFGATH